MSELPGRPDLGQLRRQARELLRAAAKGESSAVARLRRVSERVTLSAAQLAVAREYGYRSWPALKADVERRRLLPRATASPAFQGGDERASLDAFGERWSFGGAAAIKTSAGALVPEALLVGAGHAALYASLMPSDNGPLAVAMPRRLALPGRLFARPGRRARRRLADASVAMMRALADEVTVVDDRGAAHSVRPQSMSGKHRLSGEAAGPRSVQLSLDPAPQRGVGWLELRCQDGPATRLVPSAPAAVRVGQVTPLDVSPAERELADHALSLIALHLGGDAESGQDILGQRCSAALARTAEIQRSAELDPASELPGQLTRLCAALTGHRPAAGLPPRWSGMLGAAHRADGPRHHLDLAAALPPIDGVAAQLDSLVSLPTSWRLYLRAMPGWWKSSEDGHRRWNPVSVQAQDDRGGTYLAEFGGSTGSWPRGQEELGLRFLPRLDPLAHALQLTFRGANKELRVDLGLEAAARSQRE